MIFIIEINRTLKFAYPKSSIETLEKGVKYAQN